MAKYNTNRNISLRDYYRIILLIATGSIITMSIIIISFSKVSAFHQAKEYVFVKKWGTRGTADGQFQRPHDLDFDPAEKYLYIIDRDGDRIEVFDKNGAFMNKWGSQGTGEGQFNLPYGLDVDSQGNVWVAEREGARIQKFDSNGNFIKSWGSKGTGDGHFIDPEHLAIDSDGYVYVSDRGNNNIKVFKPIDAVPHK
jgi:DNA-binding beta-propeller fold protein YncE